MKQPINNGILESDLDCNGYGFVNVEGLLGTFQGYSPVLDTLAATSPSYAGLQILQFAAPGVDSLLGVHSNGVPYYAAGSGYVPSSRIIHTQSPLDGGGALTGDLTLSISVAGQFNDGYLSAADWNVFNGKVAATRSVATTAPLSGGGDFSANRTISITQATTSSNGYLSSTDWNTFNGKQAALGFTPVPNTRTVNGHALSSDVTVTPTDLGLVIGTNVQAYSANLTTLAAQELGSAGLGLLGLGNPPASSYIKISSGGVVSYQAVSTLEPALGNPGTDGFLLSSTVLGVRSWVAVPTNALAVASNWIRSYDSLTGSFTKSRPAIADLSDAGQLSAWAGKAPYVGSLTIATGKTFNVTGTLTLAGTDGKTLTISNNVTLSGIDGAVFDVGSGGTALTQSDIGSLVESWSANLDAWSAFAPSIAALGSDLDTDGTLAANSDAKVPSQKAVATYVAANAGPGYKVYAALLTQSGTDAPVATVLANTLGGTVVWSYDGTGNYSGTLSGAFTANKVPAFSFITIASGGAPPAYDDAIWILGNRGDNDIFILKSFTSAGGPSDDLLNSTFIEIRVYP